MNKIIYFNLIHANLGNKAKMKNRQNQPLTANIAEAPSNLEN